MSTITEDELALRRAQASGESGDGEGDADGGEGAEGGEGAGQALEPPQEPKPPKLLQEPLPGDWDAISNVFGGADPDRAEIRLLGGKMPIEGSFAKGVEMDLLVRVRITGVQGQDLEDAYGQKGGTVRRHFARMISVRRVNKAAPAGS